MFMCQFLNKKYWLLFFIILFSLAARLWRLNTPSYPYFDEIYHVPAARLIAANDPRAYEWWHQPILSQNFHDWLHPPAAKLIQAGSIRLFGNRSLAWRLPSALAGTGLILAVYLLAQQVFKHLYSEKKVDKISLLAALLTAMSGLVLVQSRIAMNDIFLTLCLVLSVLFFYRWKPSLIQLEYFFGNDKQKELFKNQPAQLRSPVNLIISGLFLGLALAAKWTALFLIIFLFLKLTWFVLSRKTWKLLPITVFSFIILPTAVYLSSYTQMFLQNKDLIDLVELHQQIIWYQFNRAEGHQYSSTPAEWLINLRPVLYWRDDSLSTQPQLTDEIGLSQQPEAKFTQRNDQDIKRASSNQEDGSESAAHSESAARSEFAARSESAAHIYALGNPAIHILAQISLINFCGLIIKDKLRLIRNKLYLTLIFLYCAVWLPWIVSPRVMFYHHYLPAIPFLSLIISEFLQSYLKPFSKKSYWVVIVMILISFAVFYPHWTGITVPKSWAEQVYFGLQSWQ